MVFEFSGNPEVVERAMTYEDAPEPARRRRH
ncbi:hypothetical protein ACUY2P_01450 [Corynebacterium hadale]